VPEVELLRRLGGRYICSNCQAPNTIQDSDKGETARCANCGGELYQREDDRPEAVKRRIEVYQKETMPVLDFYRERDLLADVPGVGDIRGVNQLILGALGQELAPGN
jgi:adenylate kinase